MIEPTKEKLTRQQTEEFVKANGEEHSPADQAAAHFQLKYPHFKKGLEKLSKNELIRVCLNLAGGPLVPKENRTKNPFEKKMLYLGEELIHALTVMKVTAEMERLEEAQQTNNPEQQEEKKEEVTNG